MKKIVFATQNMGKLREIKQIFADVTTEIYCMKDLGLDLDIDETGTTFEENALIKAQALRVELDKRPEGGEFIVMADDSGFEVDYLGGEPGIYSARYMGTDTPYSIKNQSILDKLAGVPEEQRGARFRCAIACIMPDGEQKVVCESYEGLVAQEAKGEYGFGYDPIFFVPQFGCNDAELLPEVKNTVSHRAKALNKMRDMLR